MMRALILAAALTGALVTASAAVEYSFTIANTSSSEIDAMSVSGGKVAGFKSVRPGQNRTVTVTLADGTCKAGVKLTFSDGAELNTVDFDFCNYDTLPVEDGQ